MPAQIRKASKKKTVKLILTIVTFSFIANSNNSESKSPSEEKIPGPKGRKIECHFKQRKTANDPNFDRVKSDLEGNPVRHPAQELIRPAAPKGVRF